MLTDKAHLATGDKNEEKSVQMLFERSKHSSFNSVGSSMRGVQQRK